MRKSFACLAVSVSLLTSGGAWGAEGLFSDVSLNSTLLTPSTGQSSQTPMKTQEPEQLPPSGPADQLGLALLVAGYQPKEVSKNVVSITMKVDELSIPVLVITDNATGQLKLTLLLSSLTNVRQLPTANLLKLMSSNRTLTPALFAYNEQSQQIELQTILPAAAAGDARLRTELDNLAEIARKSEKTWNIGQPVTSPVAPTENIATAEPLKVQPVAPTVSIAPAAPETPAPQTPAPTPSQVATPAPAKSPSLTGKWSSALSDKDAFALMLKKDGSFVLVHVKNGKKTQTSGKSLLAGNFLTLTSTDGTKLSGTVTLKSGGEFDFRPQSSSANAKSLTFKKAG